MRMMAAALAGVLAFGHGLAGGAPGESYYIAGASWNGGSCSAASVVADTAAQAAQLHVPAHNSGSGTACTNNPCCCAQTSTVTNTETQFTETSACTGQNYTYPILKVTNPKNPPCCNPTGNPISASSGNKYQAETDLDLPSIGLKFQRYHNSETAYFSPGEGVLTLGTKWRSNVLASLFLIPSTVNPVMQVRRANGQLFTFKKISGQWTTDADVELALVENGAGYALTDVNGAIEQYAMDAKGKGRLVSITQPSGAAVTFNYDTSRRLTSIVGPFGHTLTVGRDTSNRISSLGLPGGESIGYVYGTNNNLQRVNYPDDTAKVYHYEKPALPNHLTGISYVDAQGVSKRYANFDYNAAGKATLSEHAGGAGKVTLGYNVDGSTTVTDALNTSRTYGFEARLGVVKNTSITEPCSSCGSSAMTYDDNGNVASRTDFNGNVTTYVYDLVRNLETYRTEAYGTPLARTIGTEWHPTHRLPSQVDEFDEQSQLVRRTTYTYDAAGNRLTHTVSDVIASESRTTTWTYNALGQVLTINGARDDISDVADVTTYTYYTCTTGSHCGQIQTITNALGHETEITSYDANGRPLTIEDPNGVVMTLTYDSRQRVKTRTISGATTTFDYDASGQIDKVAFPGGGFLDYTYDDARRLTGIEDYYGNRIQYTLDAMGNRTEEKVFDPSDALKRAHLKVFNSLGRLEQVKDADGQVVSAFGYDDQGNQTSQTDYSTAAVGHTTVSTPDALNRIWQVTDAAGGVTEYGYNALDQLISVEDPENLKTSYTINALGDVTRQDSRDTGVTDYTYDAAGNRRTQSDARGVLLTYSYDALNRLVTVDYPGTAEDVTYWYDGANYPTGITNGIGRLTGIEKLETGMSTIYYDARGNVTEEANVIAGTTYTTTYSYDSADRVTGILYPTGRSVSYERNKMGQITKVTTAVGAATPTTVAESIGYMPFGGIKGYTLGNGVTVTRTHDQDYRLEEIKDQGTATVQDLKLHYDLRGNIESLEDLVDIARSQTLDYDGLSRLTSADGTYGLLGYTYDGVGNRLTETMTPPGATDTYTYPATSHRLSSQSTGASLDYDDVGAVEAKGALSLAYNNAHRASLVALGGTQVGNLYNPAGQRVRKSVGAEQTTFHYDRSGQLIAETGTGGALIQREYVWLEDVLLSVVADVYRATVVMDNTDAGFGSTGVWVTSTTAAGYNGADYVEHTPAGAPSGTQALDDLDSGTSKTGTWISLTGTPPGYEGLGYQRSAFSLTPNTFTWSLPLITPGDHRVYVRWVSDPSFSTDARYTVVHSGGTATLSIDQSSGGGAWYLLGTYSFASTAEVSLTDPAGGTLIADAVRVIPVTSVVDTASWDAPEAQSYEVYARWPAAAHHPTRAIYAVAHAGGATELIRDQTQDGGQWHLLGTYAFAATSQGVSLQADPDRTTVADAVKFVPVGASVTQATTAYVHVDNLGTPQKMTDGGQQVVWNAAYEPFGTASITKQPYYDNPLRFPGQYFDTETGLHQNWHRDYDPSIGRYLQSDPIGLYAGLNTYAYVDGNPLRYFDFWGLGKCTYSISQHKMVCENDAGDQKSVGSDGVHSGQGRCKNNPECSSEKNVGPIPPGTYEMENSNKYGGSFWLKQGFFTRQACKLGVGRCEFFLHEGTYSAGCITVDKNDESMREQFKQLKDMLHGDSNNTLTVEP